MNSELEGDIRHITTLKTYDRHSPSSCNLFAATTAMFVAERFLGRKQPVGAPAHRGAAVEDGVTHGLLDLKAPMTECFDAAFETYDARMAMSGDPRRDHYRATIPDMVAAALVELREYGTPTEMQGRVEWKPDGLKFPIMGYFDYRWANHNIIADLKTTERMPSQIKISHARQVALYAGDDDTDARLIYVTPKKLEPYKLENISEHRKALYNIAKRIENFKALSDDPNFFVSITVPDLESFYWTTPQARQMAWEIWGI